MIMNVRARHKRALYRAGVALLAASLATLGLGAVPVAAAQTLPETSIASSPEVPPPDGQESVIRNGFVSGASVCSRISDPLSPPPVSVFIPDGDGLRDCAAAMGDTESPVALQGDPHEEHAQFLKQYGDIGCSVVPGFNDRCPNMVSEPYDPDGGGDVHPGRLVGSPDGSMLYATALGPDFRMAIVAYHTTPDEPAKDGSIAWSRRFGPEGKLTGAVETAISHDGKLLYAVGLTRSVNGDNTRDNWVAAFNTANGGLAWQRSMRDLMGQVAAEPAYTLTGGGLVVRPDGDEIAISAGVVYESPSDLAVALASRESWHFGLDAVSGGVNWKAAYTEQPNLPGWFGESLAYSPDGRRLFAQVIATKSPVIRVRGVAGVGGSTQGFATLAYDTESGSLVWDQTYQYPTQDRVQNPPGGLAVSPNGQRVIAAGTHYFKTVTTDMGPGDKGKFLLLAYDADDGAPLWADRFPARQNGCGNNWPYVLTAGRALVFSPSGDVIYLVGGDGDNSGGCTDDVPSVGAVRGSRVFAVRVSSGNVLWNNSFFMDAAGRSCFPLYACDITLLAGPTGGDAGSRVVITTMFEPHGGPAVYFRTVTLDALSGLRGEHGENLLWQARYLDTYNDGETGILPYGTPVVVGGGSRLYVMIGEWSKTRGWPLSLLILGYDM